MLHNDRCERPAFGANLAPAIQPLTPLQFPYWRPGRILGGWLGRCAIFRRKCCGGGTRVGGRRWLGRIVAEPTAYPPAGAGWDEETPLGREGLADARGMC